MIVNISFDTPPMRFCTKNIRSQGFCKGVVVPIPTKYRNVYEAVRGKDAAPEKPINRRVASNGEGKHK